MICPISQDQLRKLLDYNPESGLFTWKVKRGWVLAGAKAGHLRRDGYLTIRIIGRLLYAHRLAWLYIYGEWPNIVDHKDHNPSNNKIFKSTIWDGAR